VIAYYKPEEMALLIEALGEPDDTRSAPEEQACVDVPTYPEDIDPVKTVERVGDHWRVCDPTMLACEWRDVTLDEAAKRVPPLAKDLLLNGSA
jgi:hypothetical protein